MSLWEVILLLSLSRWLGAPESKWWVVQRLQKCSLPRNPSCLVSNWLALSVCWWLWAVWQPPFYCLISRKRGYGMVFLATLATRKRFVYFQVFCLLMASVPKQPLHQPQPACEVAKHPRSRKPRSGGDEACCRQWRTNRSHVVLHPPAPWGEFGWLSGKNDLKDKNTPSDTLFIRSPDS